MKQYWRFLALLAVFFACLLPVLYAAFDPGRLRKETAVDINDAMQTVRENWSAPEVLRETEFGDALLVFDKNDRLIYAADADTAVQSPADAAQNGYLCQPITDGGVFLGIAAIPDPVTQTAARFRNSLMKTTAAVMGVILAVLLAAGLYIRHSVLIPFRRMRQFAGHIAAGRLDEPLLTERSGLFGVFSESFDLMREELRASRSREAELKQREKELIASLSHDINTPVTGIKLICEVLSLKTEDAYWKDKIENIRQKAEQIHVLSGDLLASSLEELGEMQVHCRDEASTVLYELIAEHDTRDLVNTEPIPECLISVDRNRLSQVIANVISNSYKYADTPIRAAAGFQGQYLLLSFTDGGGGVSEEELPLLTTKFYRGADNSEGVAGSGLGLYISRVLTEKMGGKLFCANADGGLCVTLLILLSR